MYERMKTLFYGVVLIVLIGIGGLVYRNAVEHPLQQIACPLDAKMCPDGTAVGRTGLSCTFPECPPPNVTLADLGISFAVPPGFAAVAPQDASSVAQFDMTDASTTVPSSIVTRRYAVTASSTPLAVIQATAIGGASGLPVPATSFTSATIGTRRFTVVTVERFEGQVDTSYYLARGNDVLRFDAIDRSVLDWTDPGLDLSTLPAHHALRSLLGTLQGE